MVDTGATMVALTYEDAERAGIRLKPSDFTRGVSTANGVTRVAPVTLERVSIGDITVRNVAASVSERGRLQTTLLGMSFLEPARARRHALGRPRARGIGLPPDFGGLWVRRRAAPSPLARRASLP